jgi:sialidase-1
MNNRSTTLLLSITILASFASLIWADNDAPSDPIGVFVAGQEKIEGVENAADKFPQYREQNVVVTNSGRIVFVCQARNKSRWSDRSGQDLVVKTSDNSGATWSQGRLIATHGLKSICPNAAVYDRETNRIHVLYNLFQWDYTDVPSEVRGEMGDLHCRQFEIVSSDEGETWSAPRDISDMVECHGAVMVVGSGEGIQLQRGPYAGRLLIAGGDFHHGKKVLCFYSDDHGETWQRSEPAPFEGAMSWASESKVAELPDGTIVLNSRTYVNDDSPSRLRTRSFSIDGGSTWSILENDPALETVSCNGSLIAVPCETADQGVALLCSVPIGPSRTHGTVYASLDGGRTWPIQKTIVPESFAYSSLLALPDGRIGLFYECDGYTEIRLVCFSLDWLLDSTAE